MASSFYLLATLIVPLVATQHFFTSAIPPNTLPSTLSPNIFTSLHGLVRQWPNVYSPIGHTMIPVTIPPFTKLYHARKDTLPTPPSPEWLALDIEQSYGIIGIRSGPTYMHTFTTTRALNLLYFDGTSASYNSSGGLDSQLLFLYGTVFGDWPPIESEADGEAAEFRRATDLCSWANTLVHNRTQPVLDGFMRMSAGFEVILCDFSSQALALRSISNVTYTSLNSLSAPPHHYHQWSPAWMPATIPDAQAAWFEWMRSGAWHNLVADPRVVPDYCRLYSYYPLLPAPPISSPKNLDAYRLISMTSKEAGELKARVGKALVDRRPRECSGVDWRGITDQIVDRYASRIAHLAELDEEKNGQEAEKLAETVRMPFRGLTNPLESCIQDYTGHLPATLAPQEVILRDAVEGVLEVICGLFLGEDWRDSGTVGKVMEWLGWSEWMRCGECGWGEICFIGSLWKLENRRRAKCVGMGEFWVSWGREER